jgi:hypothetical protein
METTAAGIAINENLFAKLDRGMHGLPQPD